MVLYFPIHSTISNLWIVEIIRTSLLSFQTCNKISRFRLKILSPFFSLNEFVFKHLGNLLARIVPHIRILFCNKNVAVFKVL